MTDKLYIARRLYDEDGTTYTEQKLLRASKYIVVLAEPGAGKTELLGSLSSQLGINLVSANSFRHRKVVSYEALIIDAFDELSRIDQEGIFSLLAKAQETGANSVVISSRSSEWGENYTHHFTEFFGQAPTIVRLLPFNVDEQKRIFEAYLENEDFSDFSSEVGRFDLELLLPNPVFLKLFADAYKESDRHFIDKSSIFGKAVEHLAKEVNAKVSQKDGIPAETKVEFANEVFAKVLLSGSEGVALTEASSDRIYPHLLSLIKESVSLSSILDTRLFKLSDKADQYQAVHKIVAEYSAAKYLSGRVIDGSDRLSLPQCLAVIAPNSVVRDELRGMLGWMAALGSESIQKEIIRLDPYAVLANGDPSCLTSSSKKLLISSLVEAAQDNPSFRRGDIWRTFSATGFFSFEVVEVVRPLLTEVDERGDLQRLFLELLVGSGASLHLVDELQELMLNSECSYYIRSLASDCLLEVSGHDHHSNIDQLINEASNISLSLAANIVKVLGSNAFTPEFIVVFFRTCESLYPSKEESVRVTGDRYFIQSLISTLGLSLVDWLLNTLTDDLSCVCGKDAYKCKCRNGISKIVGGLLDRYFELSNGPYEAEKIWKWVHNLNFHWNSNPKNSRSVIELQRNDELRQGLIKLAFGYETETEKIREIEHSYFSRHGCSHSGLHFTKQDLNFVVDYAFETKNVILWSQFIDPHYAPRSVEERGVNILRRHMRKQAMSNPDFLREWVRKNKSIEQIRYKYHRRELRYRRKSRRLEKQRTERNLANIEYVNENRALVESGGHWNCLTHFANLVLRYPEQIEEKFGDEALVRTALRNCFIFIGPQVPSLRDCVDLPSFPVIARVLYAGCLEEFKRSGSLNRIPKHMLLALRTRVHRWEGVTEKEHLALIGEVDRLIFSSKTDIEGFIYEYIKPQVANEKCEHPQIHWLRSVEPFKSFQKLIPLEWLQRYLHLPLHTQDELFKMAAQFGDREGLKSLIWARCADLVPQYLCFDSDELAKQKCIFWIIRAFYFLPKIPDLYWHWLVSDKRVLLRFRDVSQMGRASNDYWPRLSASKIERLLGAFIDLWPVVVLPSSWGSESPISERAYRYLSEIIWDIAKDNSDNTLPVLERLIADNRFSDFESNLRSIRAGVIRERSLRDFEAPSASEVVAFLDKGEVATVEGLRSLLLEELQSYQADLDGSDTTTKDIFYEKGTRLDEVRAIKLIAERLRLRLETKGVTTVVEHHLKDDKRCDLTFSKVIGERRYLLVLEGKGQWHPELYTAASEQLHQRYANHPNAEGQGVYLVLWFGKDVVIANRKKTGITTADELKTSLEDAMPEELRGVIDVFVLDVSK